MDILTLGDAVAEVEIAPRLGGGIVSYRLRDGRPVLRPPADVEDPPLGLACNLLLPWSNRISGGGFRCDGVFHPLEPNMPGEQFPIHGNGWRSAWTVAEAWPARARLTLRSFGPGPFAYAAEVVYELGDGALRMRLSVENRARRALPFGLGFHPWLPRTPDVRLRAPAGRVQLQDARYLPTGFAPVASRPEWDFRGARTLPDAPINNAFDRWDGAARIESPALGLDVEVSASPNLPVYIVYSPAADAPFFCFEPVSHLVDAHNLGPDERRDLRRLDPGDGMEAETTLAPASREARP